MLCIKVHFSMMKRKNQGSAVESSSKSNLTTDVCYFCNFRELTSINVGMPRHGRYPRDLEMYIAKLEISGCRHAYRPARGMVTGLFLS